jgi:hypothetical protein
LKEDGRIERVVFVCFGPEALGVYERVAAQSK